MSRIPLRVRAVFLTCIGISWLLLVAGVEYRLPGRGLWLVGAEHDAGVVQAGSVIRHRAWVINPTLRRLHVHIQPSCGCTVAGVSAMTLPPLGARALDLQLNTEGRTEGGYEEAIDIVVRASDRAWRERLKVRFMVANPSRQRVEL